jgi:hypothetical protein
VELVKLNVLLMQYLLEMTNTLSTLMLALIVALAQVFAL